MGDVRVVRKAMWTAKRQDKTAKTQEVLDSITIDTERG